MRRFNVSVISFLDDEFLADRKWILDFLKIYKDKVNLKYKIEARVDTFDEEKANYLKDSGCIEIQFGIESGSDKIRKFFNKRTTKDQIKEAFNLCKKYNINTYAYIIVGTPTETEDDLDMTVRFLAEIKPNLIRPTFLCPVKGTKIYSYCLENNLLNKSVTVWNNESPLKLDIDKDILIDYWSNFPDKINTYMKSDSYYRYKPEDNVGQARYNRIELVKRS
jgi:radical SAM superfamily enzyme YgiQ (UPF0313 family)